MKQGVWCSFEKCGGPVVVVRSGLCMRHYNRRRYLKKRGPVQGSNDVIELKPPNRHLQGKATGWVPGVKVLEAQRRALLKEASRRGLTLTGLMRGLVEAMARDPSVVDRLLGAPPGTRAVIPKARPEHAQRPRPETKAWRPRPPEDDW